MTANDDRSPDGNFVLRKALSDIDRRDLATRAKSLGPYLEPAKPNFIKNRLIAMFMKFGGASASLDEAKVLAASYVTSLNDLPLWAIEIACRRFGNGEVSAADVGERELSTTFRPSAPQVRKIARDHLKPFAEESTRIWMTIKGRPESQKPDQATRDRVTAEVLKATEGMRLRGATGRAEESVRKDEQRRSDTERSNRNMLYRQYQQHGVEPPEGMALCSVSLLLASGWTIQDGPYGGRVLVKPPEPPRTPRKGESM